MDRYCSYGCNVGTTYAVTPGFKEQNQASYMCVQEVHTYNNRKEQYQKQCYIVKTYL